MLKSKTIRNGLAVLALTGLLSFGCYSKSYVGPTPEVKNGYSFLVFADNRSRYEEFRKVLDLSEKLNEPDVSFLIGVGDIGDVDVTASLLKEYHSAPWYPVRGNHEKEKALESIEKKIFPNLPNIVNIGPTGEKGTIYSFDYKNAHFVVLDCYYQGWDGNIHNIPEVDDPSVDQFDWLKDDLEKTKKDFKFVFLHESAYPRERHVGDSLDKYPEDRDALWKLLSENNVTALLTGHTHRYYRVFKDGLYEVNAGEPCKKENNIVYIEVKDNHVNFRAYKKITEDKLDLIDEWTVGKK